EAVLPSSVTLGGRTGAVLSGLALLLLAGGIARGQHIAFRLTIAVLVSTIAFVLVKDLDFEAAALFAWILAGLWWFRHHFDADSEPTQARWGIAVLLIGVLTAVVYALAGAALLQNQLQPEFGFIRTLETLVASLAGSPARYHALTERANWFLGSLPVVSYALVICALVLLLRPVFAPRVATADRMRLHQLLKSEGRNHISHLAVHGASSYHWVGQDACVAFTLRGRTALALGDPIAPASVLEEAIADFAAYCDRQDWIPAFYQVDDPTPYRRLGLKLVPVGAEAVLKTDSFSLSGRRRADLRYAVHRAGKEGLRFTFAPGPQVIDQLRAELNDVSGSWLQSHRSPELGYSLGTLATLSDPDIVVGLATSPSGRVEAFVSWLPVPARDGWTLDLMRRRPDSTYGAIEAVMVKSIEEASRRGIAELSLGMTPRVIHARNGNGVDRALRAMFWGLDRFQRSHTLQRFKEKFGPSWEDRFLAVPTSAVLPEVMVALVRAHLPPMRATLAWVGSKLTENRPPERRRAVA
ncbi:MAG TPA: phosphatidylglycerol lysyltransferase domain-containing protein, partial [Candidatus Dormibacteraeota bacterium]|nr:phosphatidylglycerol lysyltransferase domain-containing protein [Candidatus Dormibacteraeota bacterium]